MSVLFLSGNYFLLNNSAGTTIVVDFNGIWRSAGTGEYGLVAKSYSMTAFAALVALISFITIFFYRNRKLQIKFVGVLISVSVLLIILSVYHIYSVSKEYEVTLQIGFRLLIPPFLFLLSLLALRGIRKDEDLVRSYDRLR
jgi:glucan phosphoethanolaminetransferase (alkaline phosphatase superfamily)